MNWTDFAVIAIIIIFIVICFKKGFILSVLDIGSMFITFIITLKYYPAVSNILVKTKLFDSIAASISKSLSSNALVSGALAVNAQTSVSEAVRNTLPLPVFAKDQVVKMIPNLNDIVPMSSIVNSVSSSLAKLVISAISILLLFIIVRFILMLVTMIIRKITKLPVIKQIDKLLGIGVGVLEGFLMVYIAMAFIVLLGSLPILKPVLDALDKSLFAGIFYNHNLILDVIGSFFKPA